MHARVKRFLKSNSGFTLIELIIVIGIMGFLVAMIAPRLAGVMGGAVDAVCDSNQTRLEAAMAAYTEQNGAMPDNLMNLVLETSTAGTFVDPTVAYMSDDDNAANGVEVFSSEFINGIGAHIHYLNQDEINELVEMGVTSVRNLNFSRDDVDVYNGNDMFWNTSLPESADLAGAHMEEVDLRGIDLTTDPAVAVLMYGGGYSSGATPTLSRVQTAAEIAGGATEGDTLHQAELAFRIVLGVGPDSDLVRDGLITRAGMCPGGLQRSDHFAYNNYNIALPRLGATVERLPNDVLTMTFTDQDTAKTWVLDTSELGGQEPCQFTTLCPEGHAIAGTAGMWELTGVTEPAVGP